MGSENLCLYTACTSTKAWLCNSLHKRANCPIKRNVERRCSTELLPFQRSGLVVCQELFENCHRDFTIRSVVERTIVGNVYEHQLCWQCLLLLLTNGWQTHELAKLCSNSSSFCCDEEIELRALLSSCLLLLNIWFPH